MTTFESPKAIGMLVGPAGEFGCDRYTISIWLTRDRGRKHLDPKTHGKIARQAAEEGLVVTPPPPNPCLVPLDEGNSEDGPHVYALITYAPRKLE